jgi:hypothetical protein
MTAPSTELANSISGGIVTSALGLVQGSTKHCHSAILVYLYYLLNAGLCSTTYAASLIFRLKVRFLVIQGAVMLERTFGGPADQVSASFWTPTVAVRARGNEGPAPLSNHASHFRFVEDRITSPPRIKVFVDGIRPSFSYQPIFILHFW